MPIQCEVCKVTLLRKYEKRIGRHETSHGCTDALIRHINRTFARSSTAIRHIENAKRLLDELLEETIKVYLYPEHSFDIEGVDPRDELGKDPQRLTIGSFDARIKDGNIEDVYVYHVTLGNLEPFLRLAGKHGCSEVYW